MKYDYLLCVIPIQLLYTNESYLLKPNFGNEIKLSTNLEIAT